MKAANQVVRDPFGNVVCPRGAMPHEFHALETASRSSQRAAPRLVKRAPYQDDFGRKVYPPNLMPYQFDAFDRMRRR